MPRKSRARRAKKSFAVRATVSWSANVRQHMRARHHLPIWVSTIVRTDKRIVARRAASRLTPRDGPLPAPTECGGGSVIAIPEQYATRGAGSVRRRAKLRCAPK